MTAITNYLDLDLLIEKDDDAYRARVIGSPGGQASSEFRPPFSPLELENFLLKVGMSLTDIRRNTRRIDSSDMAEIKSFGGRLFRALFDEQLQPTLVRSLDEARRRQAGTLWPEEPVAVAGARLRTGLWRLRSQLPAVVDVMGDSISLSPGWQVDYRSACDLAERMSKNPATDPLDIPRWVLFTEDLLPDWYEPWLEPAQRAFRETRIHALEWIARKRLLQGEHWLAIEACGAALTAEPLRQSAHQLMAEIYRAEGNEVLAVRHLEDTRSFLEAQLG